MAFCTLTKNGKCDVNFTFYNKENTIIAQKSITFDVRPTIKGLKNFYKIEGAAKLKLTTTPSCNAREFNLKN